jgi:hypothetical protein
VSKLSDLTRPPEQRDVIIPVLLLSKGRSEDITFPQEFYPPVDLVNVVDMLFLLGLQLEVDHAEALAVEVQVYLDFLVLTIQDSDRHVCAVALVQLPAFQNLF